MVNPIKTNFTAGILDPRLFGRTDLSWYYNGCEELQNMIALPHGPAIRRVGTRHIAEVKDSASFHRLQPFEFSKEVTQAYGFVFGDKSLRLLRERAEVVVEATDAAISNGTFDNDITGWDDRSNGSAAIEHNLDLAASVDTLQFAGTFIRNWGDAAAADRKHVALKFTAPESGTVVNASIAVVGVTAAITAEAAIYTDNAGSPGSIVGTASDTLVIGTTGTFTLVFSTPPAVTGATDYWIVFSDTLTTGNVNVSACADQGSAFATGRNDTITSITDGSGPTTGDLRVKINIATAATNGRLALVGAGSSVAAAEQDVTTTNTGQSHVLTFRVLGALGDTVTLRIGNTSEGDQVLTETEFAVGTHSVAFTPQMSPFYIQFRNAQNKTVAVDDVTLLGSGAGAAVPFELATPYETADLPRLKLNQTFDVVYLFHPQRPQHKLLRFGDTSWSMVQIDFTDGPYLPENVDETKTLRPLATSGETTVEAVGHMPFASTDVDRLIRINHSGTWGVARVTEFISATEVRVTVLTNFGAATAQAAWRLGLWSETSGFSTHGTIHEERLVQGGAAVAPDRIDGSKIGAFEDYTPGTEDDDPLSRSLAGNQANNILWMISAEALLIGTLGREVRLVADDQQSALTPSNSRARKATTRGSADILAVEVGDAVLFVQRQGRTVRELAFNLESDGFRAPSMTRRAQHLPLSGIRDMAYQQEPWSVLWVVLNSGDLLGFTYVREEEVLAWHLHKLGGNGVVEAVTTIPGTAQDDVYLIVRRTINGQTRRYIEVLENEFEADTAQEDAFFVDSGLTYDGAPATTISGLDHLEGETVQILADGAVHPDRTVSGGQIVLRSAASKVHVGLGYQSRLKPVRFDAGASPGSSAQGRKQRVSSVVVRLNRSLGFKIGRDDASLNEAFFRSTDDPMGKAPPLFTGDKEQAMPSKWDRANDILIVQDAPLPLEVVALMPQITVSED